MNRKYIIIGAIVLILIIFIVIGIKKGWFKKNTPPATVIENNKPVVVPKTPPVKTPTPQGKVQLLRNTEVYNDDWTLFGDFNKDYVAGTIIGNNGDWYLIDIGIPLAGDKYINKSAVKTI